MPKIPETLTVSIPEAAHLLGLSRNGAYEAAKRGELPTVRFGRRIVVSKPALMRLLEEARPKGRKPDAVA